MLNILVEKILEITDGKLEQGKNIMINNFSIDSRTIKKEDFFIAIKGENYDGHDYIVEAYKKGAIGTMMEIMKLNTVKNLFKKKGYSRLPSDFIIIKVKNTIQSLGLIAAF